MSWNYTFDVVHERINITSMNPSPDPSWRFTDAAGHEHWCVEGADWPMLQLVIDEKHWCSGWSGDHDEHWVIDACHYECILCGEVIEPGMLPGSTPRFMHGPLHATLIATNEHTTVRVAVSGRYSELLVNTPEPGRQALMDQWMREARWDNPDLTTISISTS